MTQILLYECFHLLREHTLNALGNTTSFPVSSPTRPQWRERDYPSMNRKNSLRAIDWNCSQKIKEKQKKKNGKDNKRRSLKDQTTTRSSRSRICTRTSQVLKPHLNAVFETLGSKESLATKMSMTSTIRLSC